jgi:type IV secretory pathway component VirB8
MSDGGVFQSFKAAYGPPHGLYYKEGLKRQVKITRDSALSDGIHQIEFETRDFIEGRPGDMQGAEPVKTEWVATITYAFSDKQVRANEAALDFNPMGLVITEYTIARRQ